LKVLFSVILRLRILVVPRLLATIASQIISQLQLLLPQGFCCSLLKLRAFEVTSWSAWTGLRFSIALWKNDLASSSK